MPNEYPDEYNPTQKKKYVWRNGKPYVAENMNTHWMSRGSGRYGSGLYTYLTAHQMLGLNKDPTKNWENEQRNDRCKVDVSYLKFFQPTNLDELEHLSDKMLDMARDIHNNPPKQRDINWLKSFLKKSNNIDDGRLDFKRYHSVINQLKKDGLNRIDNDVIIDSVLKTVECMDKNDDCKCSQPINHLLIENGFDGVEPIIDDADDNHHGIVIFQESIRNTNIQTNKKQFCGRPDKNQEIIGNNVKYDKKTQKILDDKNPSYNVQDGDMFDCQVRFVETDSLKTNLEIENQNSYLKIMQEIPENIRKEYRTVLTNLKNKSKESLENPVLINDEVFNACNKWEGSYTPTTNCKKLHKYWKKELMK